jgi:hypothetical protein
MPTRPGTPAEAVTTVYLVIKSDMTMRLAKPRGNSKLIRLAANEVAVQINLVFPRSWASVIGTMDIDVPDHAPTFTWSPLPEEDKGD